MNRLKKLSSGKKMLLLSNLMSFSMLILLTIIGKIKILDGLLFIVLPVAVISIITIFMIKLIFASVYEENYTGKLSPVYKRLLRNREKIGRER